MLMLRSLGLGDNLLERVHAFLSNRYMSVCVDGAHSRPVEVVSGVPQESVLGPLLFLIYVHHISARLTCQFKAFADDYKLYLHFSRKKSSLEAIEILQDNLNSIDQVAKSTKS